MKKEYFIGDRRKYGVTLMETVKLEERLPGREIFEVKWTRLTDYKGINTQVFPMVRTNGEFYDFTPISKSEYDKMLAIIKQVSEEIQPLLVVKRQIDAKICTAHKEIWKIADKNDNFTPVSYEQVRKIIEKQINENKRTPLTPTRG